MPLRRPRAAEPIVTIVADLGAAYVAQMVGVLTTRAPRARILPLVVDLPRQDLRSAAWVLRAVVERFPPGSIHLCIVDPGVGTSRAPIAIECRGGRRLVGPDNGVLRPAADRLGVLRTVRIVRARVAPPGIGSTFDGRDLFAPAAAELATGRPLTDLGPPHVARALPLERARRTRGGARAGVVYVDPFGNAITDAPSQWLPAAAGSARVTGGRLRGRAAPIVRSYAELGRGGTGLLRSSFGTIEIGVDRGSAAARWRLPVGTSIGFQWMAGARPTRRGLAEGSGPGSPRRPPRRGSIRSGG